MTWIQGVPGVTRSWERSNVHPWNWHLKCCEAFWHLHLLSGLNKGGLLIRGSSFAIWKFVVLSLLWYSAALKPFSGCTSPLPHSLVRISIPTLSSGTFSQFSKITMKYKFYPSEDEGIYYFDVSTEKHCKSIKLPSHHDIKFYCLSLVVVFLPFCLFVFLSFCLLWS